MIQIHRASITAASGNETSCWCLKKRDYTEFKRATVQKTGGNHKRARERETQQYVDAGKEKEN